MTEVTEKYREPLATLRNAYGANNLSLYLGAGVSVDSGLPSWEHLVAAMYFAALGAAQGHRELTFAFRNYLLAISEWYLRRSNEPMDITARKVRAFYGHDTGEFLMSLRDTLYAAMIEFPGDQAGELPPDFLDRNTTLRAVRDLCANAEGVSDVVTYNYDNLLELALGDDRRHQSIWRANQTCSDDTLPCFHVHGCIPLDPHEKGSDARDIIFTEEQFHEAANTSYSWSNIAQLKSMSSTVGLTIGLSLTDRNMRRLLDAVARTPLKSNIFAILRKPRPEHFSETDQDWIRARANEYQWRYSERARMKAADSEYDQVERIIRGVEMADLAWQESVLRELGVEVLWIDDYRQIPELTRAISD